MLPGIGAPIKIHKSEKIDREGLIHGLAELGYSRSHGVSEPGDFALRGENIFIYPRTFEYPVRIELDDDDTVRKIASIDTLSFTAFQEHSSLIIMPAKGLSPRARRYHEGALDGRDPIDIFVDIKPGDYVVHIDYGIGIFIGIKKIKEEGKEEKKFAIEYQDREILYVPFSDLDKVQRYIFFSRRKPRLYRLGSKKWKKAKERAASGVLKIAEDILEIQAKRQSMIGHSFSPDTDWQGEIEKAFPFKETEDQLKATREVKMDMEKPRPMDRLLCGDVGYGKTEVALRAIFKCVMDNKQAAMLVPTTILAEQHYATFKERLKDYPVNIEMLSRFRKKEAQEEIIKKLRDGRADIVIGTHRLLSGDIAFKDLGLVVIDEEQRFGVRHKEKLKKMRLVVDVLTLTATPIPRTLYLALMGGRDISTINTPPLERQPVNTHIIKYDEHVLKDAIKKELDRNGQVYIVNNKIKGIEKLAENIKKLVPGITIAIGHGRMHEKDLENTMIRFINGDVDALVATTIIQSGIDIPNANTIIVNNADEFGLADLYQLRGRVGRFNRKAHAYFIVRMVERLTHEAQRRLAALEKFTELGSGFKLAMQDLELRGAGNLLGVRQHGYIEQIGFDLYCRLLRSAIERIKKE